MPEGTVSQSIKDGGLGLLDPSVAGIVAKFGYCSLGTPATVYQLSSIDDVSSQLGTGPLAESTALQLAIAGGSVICVPVTGSVAGTNGTVTPTRVATSTGTMTPSGTPNDEYKFHVVITSAGTGQLVSTGNVTAKISLDGGATYLFGGASVAIPVGGSYVVSGTGVTLAFSVSAANFDFGDKFDFSCTSPFYTTSDLATAVTALKNDGRPFGLLHLVGFPTAGNSSANATASATFATAVATHMASFEAAYQYARAVVELPPSTDADIFTAYASFADTRVRLVGGTEVQTSSLTGRQYTRAAAWTDVARLASIPISESPGDGTRGPLKGVVSLVRDERKTPGFYDKKFGYHTTEQGQAGFWSDIGLVCAPAGSDYKFIMNGRVMDAACTAARGALMKFKNTKIPVDSKTGFIDETTARIIEKAVDEAVRSAVVRSGDASDCKITVRRDDNLLSTNLLRLKTRLIGLAYAENISNDIGFLNPALVPV